MDVISNRNDNRPVSLRLPSLRSLERKSILQRVGNRQEANLLQALRAILRFQSEPRVSVRLLLAVFPEEVPVHWHDNWVASTGIPYTSSEHNHAYCSNDVRDLCPALLF